MKTRSLGLAAFICLLFLSASAQEPEPADPKPSVPEIRMLWLQDGLRRNAKGEDPKNIPEILYYNVGKSVGVDLMKPKHPTLAVRFNGNRIFYLFFKQIHSVYGRRGYVVQRIKKTVRDWPIGDDKPVEKTTYKVEVFKTFGGAIKRPDQHYGAFSLRDEYTRREIIKEYEVGIGEIPGVCEGLNWPFEQRYLFKEVQSYQADRDLYDEVDFLTKTNWSLKVAFADDGTWSVASPELGFNAPKEMPGPEQVMATLSPKTKDVVLVPGTGLKGLDAANTTLEDLKRELGETVGWTELSNGASNVIFAGGISASLNPRGILYILSAEPEFGGRTDKGIRMGDSRFDVLKTMGVAQRSTAHAPKWRYGTVSFWFDAFDRVERIFIYNKAKSEWKSD